MIGILVQPLTVRKCNMYEKILKAAKGVCLVILCGIGGFILGDEFANRLERSEMRNACYKEMAVRLESEPDHMQDLFIRFQCRSNIP